MKKVTSIHIGGKVIPIEDSAYSALQAYIEALRAQLTGDNIEAQLDALEHKIADLLNEKISKGAASIGDSDIRELAESKPAPTDFGGAATSTVVASTAGLTHRLYRDSNDKILGGVCSGVAHLLNIDPTFVRLAAAVFALSGWGILVYLVLWAIIPSKDLEPYAGRRIYRNNDHKVIAGVASGIADYFHIDVTIVRILFVVPFLLNLAFGAFSWPFFAFGFWFPGIVLGSFVFPFVIAYIALWIVLPVSSKSTIASADTGEPQPRPSALGQGLGLIIKVFFIFIAALIALTLFASLSASSFVALSLWPLTDFLWSGEWQQIFFAGTVVLFIGLPLIALLVWLLRRIFGVKRQSGVLSWIFSILWTLGWISAILLVVSLVKDLRYYENSAAIDVPISAQPADGKLVVAVTQPELAFAEHYWWIDSDSTGWNLSDDELQLSFVKIKVNPSHDSQYHAVIKKFSAGNSRADAKRRAALVAYNATYANGVLDLGNGFTVSKVEKYRGQIVEVDISVPIGKKIRFADSVREKLNPVHIKIESGKAHKSGGISVSTDEYDEFDWDTDTDYVMSADGELTYAN